MKHRPSPLGIAFCLSLVTSAGIVGYRSTNSPSGQMPEPNVVLVSDGARARGIPEYKIWQVLVFKNYQCPACRQRIPEFEQFKTKHQGKVLVRDYTYILPRFELALAAARVAEASKLLGNFNTVHKILLGGPALTKESIEKANAVVSKAMTPDIESKVKAELSSQAITGAKFQFEGIPAIYAISPSGGIYKVSHMGAIESLMEDENAYRPKALKVN